MADFNNEKWYIDLQKTLGTFTEEYLGKVSDGRVKQIERGIELGNKNSKSGLLKKIASKGGHSTYEKYGNPAEGKYGKAILQYDLDGNYIREWMGCFEAAEYVNGNRSLIYEVLWGNLDSAYGYMWKKKLSDDIPMKIESLYNIQHPICPHCNKRFSIGMYNRWHGDKCKHKK